MVLKHPEKIEHCECYSNVIPGISKKIPNEDITLKEFIELIGESGRLIICMLIAAPFLIPISIPGTGIIAGLIIFAISISIMFDKDYLIPNRLMKLEMSKKSLIRILNATFRVLTRLEKFIKPRLLIMTNRAVMRSISNLFLVFSATLFIFPLPIPLTDTLPALGVFFLAAGTLECDGYLILAGYAVVIITAIYFISVILLGWAGISAGLSYFGL
jgi:hypothetical protein